MRHLHRSVPIALFGLMLVACTAEDPTFSIEPIPSVPTQESVPASAAPSASPSASAEPTDDLGPFTCDLPIHVDGTVARTNIVDVRVATHDGYDRVVFEFSDGTPEFTLNRAVPPFTQDASGLPLDVEGESFLQLVMRGGTKQTDDGTSSYDGPTDFDPGFQAVVDLIEGGDFEGQSTWYVGLTAEACVRLSLLDNGQPRLVIDIEQ
jgi:hypothetical protein